MPRLIYPDLTRVQLEGARKRIDHQWLAIADSLDDAYYGTSNYQAITGRFLGRETNGWRHGVSHPWRGFDKQATVEQSKQAFDFMTGWLGHWLTLLQHFFNCDHSGKNVLSTYSAEPEQHYNQTHVNNVTRTKISVSKEWLRGMPARWAAAGLAPTPITPQLDALVAEMKAIPTVAECLTRRIDLRPVLDPESLPDVSP